MPLASFKSGRRQHRKPSTSLLEEDKKIRFENISEETNKTTTTSSSTTAFGLQFLDVPKGDDMRIYDLRIDKEFYLLFGAFSTLMAYLLPSQFPTGKRLCPNYLYVYCLFVSDSILLLANKQFYNIGVFTTLSELLNDFFNGHVSLHILLFQVCTRMV